MKTGAFLLLLLFFAFSAFAENLDEWVEGSSVPEERQAWLDDLRADPLNLNTASVEDLFALPFWDESSARMLLEARRARGEFLSMEEALALTFLTSAQKISLQNFSIVETDFRKTRMSARSVSGIAREGRETLKSSSVWSKNRAEFRNGDRARGFLFARRLRDDTDLFSQVSVGVEFAARSIPIRFFAGDYQCESGTGLVFASSYGIGNWISAPDQLEPKRTRGFLAKPSTDRRSVFRGAAVRWKSSKTEVAILVSGSKWDAAVSDQGVYRITEGESSSPEIARARKDRLSENLIGCTLQSDGQYLSVGAAGYFSNYSPAFASPQSEDELPHLSGNRLQVGSVFLRGNYREMLAVSEVAASNPGGVAHQTVFSWKNDRAGLALYHIFAAEDFFSPRSKIWGGFGEEASNTRVTGIRARFAWPAHTLFLKVAAGRTPFRTATMPLPKSESEIEARWQFHPSSPFELEGVAGRKWREEGTENTAERTNRLDRLRLEAAFSEGADFRVRYELRCSVPEGNSYKAIGTYLQFRYQQQWFSLKGCFVLSFYDFAGDDVAMQPYENSLPGAYPLVSLSGSGSRAAILLQKQGKHFSVGGKVAFTRADNFSGNRNVAEGIFALGIHS